MTAPGGRCQCGGIRFELTAPIRESAYCHCSLCRRQSGSAFSAYGEVANEHFRLTAGQELLARYDVTDRLSKWFCRTCGTTLYTLHRLFPGYSYLSLGLLDDDAGIEPAYHQFVDSKARWYDIADDLPRYAEWSVDVSD